MVVFGDKVPLTSVLSSDNTARLWDLQQAETVRYYNGHSRAVTCVALTEIA